MPWCYKGQSSQVSCKRSPCHKSRKRGVCSSSLSRPLIVSISFASTQRTVNRGGTAAYLVCTRVESHLHGAAIPTSALTQVQVHPGSGLVDVALQEKSKLRKSAPADQDSRSPHPLEAKSQAICLIATPCSKLQEFSAKQYFLTQKGRS